MAERGSLGADADMIATSGKETESCEKEGDLVHRPNILNRPVHPDRSKMILYAAAVLSLLAALIHRRDRLDEAASTASEFMATCRPGAPRR